MGRDKIYIRCIRKKSRPLKDPEVCRKCRYSRNCNEFQRYLQPEIPFVFTKLNSRVLRSK